MNLFKRTAIVASLALSLLGSVAGLPAAHAAPAADLFAPDLIISGVQNKIAGDGQEYLQITVKNAGLGNAGAFKVNIAGLGGTNLNETKSVPSLAAGISINLFHTTGFTTSCDFTRTIKVDSGGVIAEALESNNIKNVADMYCPRPDLKVTTETRNPNGHLGEYQRITVKNVGTAAAGAFQIAVTASGGTNLGTTKSVAGLAVGASMSFDFYPKAGCDYSMSVKADSGAVVKEFNEYNNKVTAADSCLK